MALPTDSYWVAFANATLQASNVYDFDCSANEAGDMLCPPNVDAPFSQHTAQWPSFTIAACMSHHNSGVVFEKGYGVSGGYLLFNFSYGTATVNYKIERYATSGDGSWSHFKALHVTDPNYVRSLDWRILIVQFQGGTWTRKLFWDGQAPGGCGELFGDGPNDGMGNIKVGIINQDGTSYFNSVECAPGLYGITDPWTGVERSNQVYDSCKAKIIDGCGAGAQVAWWGHGNTVPPITGDYFTEIHPAGGLGLTTFIDFSEPVAQGTFDPRVYGYYEPEVSSLDGKIKVIVEPQYNDLNYKFQWHGLPYKSIGHDGAVSRDETPADRWWEFGTQGTTQEEWGDKVSGLRLDADLESSVDPQQSGNDFTIACFVSSNPPYEGGSRTIFAKYFGTQVSSSRRCIRLYISASSRLTFQVHSDSGYNTLTYVGYFTQRYRYEGLIIARYKYVAHGTSEMYLQWGDMKKSLTNVGGPIRSEPKADITIGYSDYTEAGMEDLDFGTHWEGKMAWLGYWDSFLSDEATQSIREGANPALAGPLYYFGFDNDFSDAHGPTYASEIGNVVFDPRGIPAHKGSSLSGQDPGDSRWRFLGHNYSSMSAYGNQSTLLDPSLSGRSGDFSVAGRMDRHRGRYQSRHGILSKWDEVAPYGRCWMLNQGDYGLSMRISTDGTEDEGKTSVRSVGGSYSLSMYNSPFVTRYEYGGNGSSYFRLRCADLTSTTSTAYGPVLSNSNTNVMIGDYVRNTVTTFGLSASLYWLAYWNRCLTAQEEIDLIADETIVLSLNPDFYIDFHKMPYDDYYTPEFSRLDTPFLVEQAPHYGYNPILGTPEGLELAKQYKRLAIPNSDAIAFFNNTLRMK